MRRELTVAVAIVLMTGWLRAQAPAVSKETKAPVNASQPVPVGERVRLVFLVRELDERGKVLNTREYEAIVGERFAGAPAEAYIRTGARVPVSTGSQYTYLDIGVSFDVSDMRWIAPNRVGMSIRAEISSVDPTSQADASHPVIRQNKWSDNLQMSFGEQKTLFSADDLTSKNRLQVSLTLRPAE